MNPSAPPVLNLPQKARGRRICISARALKAELEALAVAQDCTLALLVREILRAYVQHHPPEA